MAIAGLDPPAALLAGALAALIAGLALGWFAGRGRLKHVERLQQDIFKSKQQLQAIFDGITDGLIIVDTEFRVVAINKAEAAFLGREPQELVGLPCYEVYCRGDSACAACPAHRTFASGKAALVPQLELSGSFHRRGVDVYTFPVRDQNGETVQAIQYIKDVTERMKLQRQLRDVEQLTGIGQMAANVAHEIRNPLIAVGGFARQLHEDMDPDDPRREHTRIILEEVTRLEQILREQLTLERHLQPVMRPVDINQILRDVRKLLSHGLLSSQTQLVGDLQDGLPVTMGDANQLKQAFLNIIGNAIQSMEDGGTVTVTSAQTGDDIVVRISDTGPGIPSDVMSKLFVPFFTTRKSGSGLGLAVTRRIVENHGGEITAESEPGKGTSFTVRLPIIRSTAELAHERVYGDMEGGGPAADRHDDTDGGGSAADRHDDTDGSSGGVS
jgi:PAS domain S-box-containing protein